MWHAGDRAGRGGVAETVDDSVGRLYPEPTSAALLAAIDAWEAEGHPHDPIEARHRAEALSGPVFRARILKLLAEVVTERSQHTVPPAPHLNLKDA